MKNTDTKTNASICITWFEKPKSAICITWIEQNGVAAQRPTISLSLENLEKTLR